VEVSGEVGTRFGSQRGDGARVSGPHILAKEREEKKISLQAESERREAIGIKKKKEVIQTPLGRGNLAKKRVQLLLRFSERRGKLGKGGGGRGTGVCRKGE